MPENTARRKIDFGPTVQILSQQEALEQLERETLLPNSTIVISNKPRLEVDERSTWTRLPKNEVRDKINHGEIIAVEVENMGKQLVFAFPQYSRPRAMSALGQAGVGFFQALIKWDIQAARVEWNVGWDILLHSGAKSSEHETNQVGAVTLMLKKLLSLKHASATISVEVMPNPRWGQAMTIEKKYESGKLVAVKILINPHLTIETLRWGAVHEMFHALEPEPKGFFAGIKEEIDVTRRTRLFMAQYHEDLMKGVLIAEQAVERGLAGIPATQEQVDREDSVFRDLLLALHIAKHHDELQTELAAARNSILGAA